MADRCWFQAIPGFDETELRLFRGTVALPFTAWAMSGHRGADICTRLVVEGFASGSDDVLMVEHAAVARLTAAEAAQLNLPPATQLRAVVDGTGVMVRTGFTLGLRWTRADGQNVLGVTRRGAWVQEAAGWRRLQETLFAVAEAVDQHAAAQDEAARISAVASLRRVLPQAAIEGTAEASGLLGSVTIVEADAMSLETIGDGDAMQVVPVLHRAGIGIDAPLLPEDRQRAFGAIQFHRWPTARSVYSLPGGVYVTISPPLRQALEVVRQAASGSPAERWAFFREPRPAIRAAIGDEADAALLDSLVIETPAWSKRVIGLGLWQPRVVPWIKLAGNDWFGDDAETLTRGLMVGDRSLPLTSEAASDLAKRVQTAMLNGQRIIFEMTVDQPIEVPANTDTLQALQTLIKHTTFDIKQPVEARTGLIIKDNETELSIKVLGQGRAAPDIGLPTCLYTPLKNHQRDGLQWLQQSWISGSPGVLLADDMGLGKTLRGLAFLAWLREGMQMACIERHPLLIVAPTGLLQNWLAEHDMHLNLPGLGVPLLAFGKGLAALRTGPRGSVGMLDTKVLAAADWVLTTYETLRDYVSDFGAVHFAAVLMDEAQKVKTPAIRMTDAAKAMKAEFRIAMTGTPVENRLADLWCIVDGVAPGYLGDLRRFSQKYEGKARPEHLAELKASLDRPVGAHPALLLRRLKEDELPGLPSQTSIVSHAVMGPIQLAAYEDAVSLGRNDQGAGRVLEALQRLRAVSLHPDVSTTPDDASLIAVSVRLQLALAALDQIAEKGERALLFVENLQLMARLTGLLQRRYRLPDPPMTINGTVAGAARHIRVERFQHGRSGFDVMLISPRAGGVGLTLTRANHVVHLTRWWNPAVEDQCTARVYRIGQCLPVTVHILLATLPDGRASFDESLHSLLARKRQLMRDALLPSEADPHELAAMLSQTLQLPSAA